MRHERALQEIARLKRNIAERKLNRYKVEMNTSKDSEGHTSYIDVIATGSTDACLRAEAQSNSYAVNAMRYNN